MVFKLPKPITDYLDADKAKDADRLALCFAGDALVHDEGRDYRGRDAIRACYPCALQTEANAKPRRSMNEKA